MTENCPKRKHVKFYVEKDSQGVKAAAVCMLLSALFRIIGCWGLWGNALFTSAQIALPIVCCLAYLLCIMLLGRKLLSASAALVILGTVFFIVRAADFVWWKMLLLIILSIFVAAVYTGTVFGCIPSKWPSAALFGLPVMGHLVYDFMRLGNAENPVGFHEGMQEISLLFMLLGLFFAVISMKKAKAAIEDADLPKMKAPKVIKPKKAEGKPAEQEKAGDKPAAAAAAESKNGDKAGGVKQ